MDGKGTPTWRSFVAPCSSHRGFGASRSAGAAHQLDAACALAADTQICPATDGAAVPAAAAVDLVVAAAAVDAIVTARAAQKVVSALTVDAIGARAALGQIGSRPGKVAAALWVQIDLQPRRAEAAVSSSSLLASGASLGRPARRPRLLGYLGVRAWIQSRGDEPRCSDGDYGRTYERGGRLRSDRVGRDGCMGWADPREER